MNCGNTNEMSMTIGVNCNLSNCENSPKEKKDFRGLNGIRTRGLCVGAAVLSQLSYEDPYTGGWPINKLASLQCMSLQFFFPAIFPIA